MTDWIEWHGGVCPVAAGTIIDVRDEDGMVWESVEALDNTNAEEMWRHEDYHPANNIYAYRLVEPSKLPEGNRDAESAVEDAFDCPPASALSTQVGGEHYLKYKIQPFQYSMANKLDPCQHTAIKYITRFRDDGGIEDLEKAKHVIDILIAFERDGIAA